MLVVAGPGTAQRAIEQLRDADVPAKLVERLSAAPEPGLVTVTCGSLTEGSDHRRRPRACSPRPTSPATGRRDRRPAHAGQQAAPQRRRPRHLVARRLRGARPARDRPFRRDAGADGRRRDPRVPRARVRARRKRGQPADRLFVPTDALDEVSRYVGGEVPTLNKLGGADWAKTKGRARKAVREIAAQLVQLYAARQSAPGHAFAPDTPWQRELEDAFPFTETPDQLSAIDEVKADMERAGADGPGDLRRRRVRQDRDRGARGVQGGAGRQAGRGPRADDAAGHPAPADLLRPDARVPGERQGPVEVHRQRGGRSRRSRAWPTAPSTSWSARTGCCRPGCGGRTSAW